MEDILLAHGCEWNMRLIIRATIGDMEGRDHGPVIGAGGIHLFAHMNVADPLRDVGDLQRIGGKILGAPIHDLT